MIRLLIMLNLPFNISEKIIKYVKDIDSIRQKVLLYPSSPRQDIKLRWEATIEKIYWGLTLADNPLSKKQMAKLLATHPPKKMTDYQKEVISYKSSIDYIRNNWTACSNLLTTRDILHIYDLSCKSVFGSTTNYFKSKEKEVSQILKYIESGNDHPIIKAGLIQIEIIKLSPFENGTGRVARLLSHLILAKYGYDLHGFLVLEEYYRSDLVTLKNISKSVETHNNATIWLEYFSYGVLKSMEKTLNYVENNRSSNIISNSFWKLNDRQQQITYLLENPDIKITNKDVQTKFNISQITASRDLAKLTAMGILLSHGKGRSVSYTKI